jgi:hypothetical protein
MAFGSFFYSWFAQKAVVKRLNGLHYLGDAGFFLSRRAMSLSLGYLNYKRPNSSSFSFGEGLG